MDPSDKPILVTGAHRSGSTFVGRILALPRSVGYVQEPFNRNFGIRGNDQTFPYVTKGSPLEPHYHRLVDDLLHLRARYKNPWRRAPSRLRALGQRVIGGRAGFGYALLRLNPFVRRLLVKDPIACMASEWLHREFGMEVVVLIRHPAAFVASLQRLDWRFDLRRLVDKNDLLEDHLRGILDPDRDFEAIAPVEEAALLWKCIYSVLTTYADRNPEMMVVSHEALSRDPVGGFRSLYARLGLSFTPRVAVEIERATGERNPADPEEGGTHSIYRDSRGSVARWKSVLHRSDVDRIRELTQDLADRYYTEADW